MDAVKIGNRLKALRGFETMEDVAKACGVTKGAIANYEYGIRIPTDDVKCKLAKHFNKHVEEIFYEP